MIVEKVYIQTNRLEIKFQGVVDVDSISNNNVFLQYNGSPIAGFKLIDPNRDYNRISRVLTVYYENIVDASTDYILSLVNLENIYGQVLESENISFTTLGTVDIVQNLEPLEPTFYLEDYSIVDDLFEITSPTAEESATPSEIFELESSSPENGSIFIEPVITNNDDWKAFFGTDSLLKIELFFSHTPGLEQNIALIQKRKIIHSYSQWENIDETKIKSWFNQAKSIILYIPMEQENYKYRITISKTLKAYGVLL